MAVIAISEPAKHLSSEGNISFRQRSSFSPDSASESRRGDAKYDGALQISCVLALRRNPGLVFRNTLEEIMPAMKALWDADTYWNQTNLEPILRGPNQPLARLIVGVAFLVV